MTYKYGRYIAVKFYKHRRPMMQSEFFHCSIWNVEDSIFETEHKHNMLYIS